MYLRICRYIYDTIPWRPHGDQRQFWWPSKASVGYQQNSQNDHLTPPQKTSRNDLDSNIYIYMKMTSMGILGLWKVSDLPGRPDSPKVIRMPSRFLLLLPPRRRGYYGPTWPETDVRCLKCHLEDVDGREAQRWDFSTSLGWFFGKLRRRFVYNSHISRNGEKGLITRDPG